MAATLAAASADFSSKKDSCTSNIPGVTDARVLEAAKQVGDDWKAGPYYDQAEVGLSTSGNG